MEKIFLKLILLIILGILTFICAVIQIVNIIDFKSVKVGSKISYITILMLIGIWIIYFYIS